MATRYARNLPRIASTRDRIGSGKPSAYLPYLALEIGSVDGLATSVNYAVTSSRARGNGGVVTILEPASIDQCEIWESWLNDADIIYRKFSEPCQVRSDIRPRGGRWYTLEVHASPDEVISILRWDFPYNETKGPA